MKKFFLIGIDGGDWEILDKLFEKGHMPFLGKLRKRYSSSVLKSTVPPLSSTAWVSIMTGVNPGKHGIYFWQSKWRSEKSRKLLTNKDVKFKQISQILTENKVKVGMMNVPFSYPVKRVDGFMISGILSPNLSKKSVYPKKLLKELKETEYDFEAGSVDVTKYDYYKCREFIKKWTKVTEARTDLFLKLVEEHSTQFNFLVLVGLDRLFHVLIGLIFKGLEKESELSSKERELFNLSIDLMNKIDESIKKTYNFAGDNPFLIISDHGFSQIQKNINLNSFLYKKGLIKPFYKSVLRSFFSKLSRKVHLSLKIRKKIKTIFNLEKNSGQNEAKVNEYIFNNLTTSPCLEDHFNLDQTSAFFGKSGEMGVYLTDKKKKEKVISLLREMKYSGEPVFSVVKPREKIYWGDYVNQAPDIMLVSERKYQTLGLKGVIDNIFNDPKNPHRGCHFLDGVIVGKGLRKKRVNTWDIAPTVYNHFGVQESKNLDGESVF